MPLRSPERTAVLKIFPRRKRRATRIGYPRASSKRARGGGGKGMRIVRNAGELAGAIRVGRAREAKTYFGDGTLYIEKYLENPHHVEVQVVGDGHGGGGHAFDRECSIQRRHQEAGRGRSRRRCSGRHPASREGRARARDAGGASGCATPAREQSSSWAMTRAGIFSR